MVIARKIILMLLIGTALGGTVVYYGSRLDLFESPQTAHNLGYLALVLMTIISLVLILITCRGFTSSLKNIRSQIRQFEQTNKIGMIMVDAHNELGNLISTINLYLSNIQDRFEKKRIECKELELQARVAETERCQTEAVICSISDAVLVINRFDELLMSNKGAQQLFQIDPHSQDHHSFEQIIKDQTLIRIIQDSRRNKILNFSRLMEKKHPQADKILTLDVVYSCARDDQNQNIAEIIVIRDVTSEKEIERMKDDFVNSVSHEFKTPLAGIRAYAEMLDDNEAHNQETYHQFCRIIQEQACRLNRLIDNILNLSRIESGVLKVKKQPVNLVRIIDDVVKVMQIQAQEKNINIETRRSQDDISVDADEDMIYQAVMNLLSNAIKYSPSGKPIRINIGPNHKNEVVIEVKDQGAGIPEEYLDRVFDKFYRVEQNRNLAGGTGLGLHLVREIVRNYHRGRVDVVSEPGLGSSFFICLPLCPRTIDERNLVCSS